MLGRSAIEKPTLTTLFICLMLGRPAIEKHTLTILLICYARSFCNREAYIKGTCIDHRMTGALNVHKIRDVCILVMVLDVLT